LPHFRNAANEVDTYKGLQKPPKGNGADANAARFIPVLLDDIVPNNEPSWLIDGLLPAGPSLGLYIEPPSTGPPNKKLARKNPKRA
jgi:hypothetical protein